MSGRWAGHRGGYDSPEWRMIRRRVLDRDGRLCQWPIAGIRCFDRAAHVDHIVNRAAGGTDDESNLWSLCIRHHLVKTSREGNAARHRLREARPPERHPGLL